MSHMIWVPKIQGTRLFHAFCLSLFTLLGPKLRHFANLRQTHKADAKLASRFPGALWWVSHVFPQQPGTLPDVDVFLPGCLQMSQAPAIFSAKPRNSFSISLQRQKCSPDSHGCVLGKRAWQKISRTYSHNCCVSQNKLMNPRLHINTRHFCPPSSVCLPFQHASLMCEYCLLLFPRFQVWQQRDIWELCWAHEPRERDTVQRPLLRKPSRNVWRQQWRTLPVQGVRVQPETHSLAFSGPPLCHQQSWKILTRFLEGHIQWLRIGKVNL